MTRCPAGLTIDTVAGTGWTCTTSGPGPNSFSLHAVERPRPRCLIPADPDHGRRRSRSSAARSTNTATVSGGGDINFANNSGSDTTEAGRAADISVVKSAAPGTINVGQTSTFTIVVTNNGPSTATSVGLDDPIPAGLEQVGNATTTQGTCQVGLVVCDLGNLAPGGSATVTVTVARHLLRRRPHDQQRGDRGKHGRARPDAGQQLR